MSTYHVYKTSERELHDLESEDCNCIPKLKDFDNGNTLVIHNEINLNTVLTRC